MEFETEKICLNQLIDQRESSFFVEENIIIPDIKPDILSTINSSGNIYVYKKELTNGKLRIDGGVQVYITYLADNEANNIRGIHTTIDFSQSIELTDIPDNIDFRCKLSIKNIECKILNGRKVNVKVTIGTSIDIYSNTEKDILKSVSNNERVQIISNSVNINSLKGKGDTIAIAKDTVSVDDSIADILDANICVRNKDIKISYNKALSKADIIVEILYLTNDEQISTVTAQIPIMGFIDINGISDNEICDSTYEIRNINIKPSNTEENSVYLEIEFLISCTAYENKKIDLIQDLYSPEKDIKMDQENVCLIENKNIINDECNIQDKIEIPEMKNGKIYNIKVNQNIIKQNVLNNCASYEGEVVLNIMYESSVTNKMEIKEQRISFTHDINSDKILKNCMLNTCVEVGQKDYTCLSDNTIEMNIVLNFFVEVCMKNNIDIVSNITVQDFNSDCRQNSLVIYFVKEGDTLWKIAKKFRSTIDEIASVNNIENIEKISIGDRLYIPKYVYNRIS